VISSSGIGRITFSQHENWVTHSPKQKNIYIIIMSQGETMILVVAMALGACCCSLSSSGAAMAFVFGKNLFGGGGADKQNSLRIILM